MRKIKLIQQIVDQGVVAVLRGDTPEQVVQMAEQCIVGGIRVIEVTMTVPRALQAIEVLSEKYDRASTGDADGDRMDQVIIGAGTVLDPETARMAMLSGAKFIVGPSLNAETVVLCNRYRVPIMPGVMTMSDIQQALELGVDIVKLFPGNLFNPSIIKAIQGPYPQANLMPTGGVSLDNIGTWVQAGAVAVGIGSDLTQEAVRTGNFTLIAKKAAQYVQAYRQAKIIGK